MRKSVIITGASRGIGKATALTFARNGYDILLCYQSREDEAKATAEEAKAFGVRAVPFQMDVSSVSDCRRTAAKALMEFGQIDALVCNAGIALPALFTQTSEEEYDPVVRSLSLSRPPAVRGTRSPRGCPVPPFLQVPATAQEVAFSFRSSPASPFPVLPTKRCALPL